MLLSHIYPEKSYKNIQTWLPNSICINSFDCARRSMGVAIVEIDLIILPKIILPEIILPEITHDLLPRIIVLEAHLAYLSKVLDNLIRVLYLDVWDLGEVTHAWEAAPPLKQKLAILDHTYGAPDILLYEFQMSQNDKSRMISTMLAYHYSPTSTVRIPPAIKNTICIARKVSRRDFIERCSRVAAKKVQTHMGRKTLTDILFERHSTIDLNIQTFLQCFTDTYKANKIHTSAMLEWWAYAFNVDLSRVPDANLDDAADAFIQTLAAIKKRLL